MNISTDQVLYGAGIRAISSYKSHSMGWSLKYFAQRPFQYPGEKPGSGGGGGGSQAKTMGIIVNISDSIRVNPRIFFVFMFTHQYMNIDI